MYRIAQKTVVAVENQGVPLMLPACRCLEVPVEVHAEWRIGADRARTRRPAGCSAAATGLSAPSKPGSTLARRQGNIVGLALREDLAVPHTWTASSPAVEGAS